jgi:hypothetical protein
MQQKRLTNNYLPAFFVYFPIHAKISTVILHIRAKFLTLPLRGLNVNYEAHLCTNSAFALGPRNSKLEVTLRLTVSQYVLVSSAFVGLAT